MIGASLIAETGFSPAAKTWGLVGNPALWIWTAVAGGLMWRRLRLLHATFPAASPALDQAPGPAL